MFALLLLCHWAGSLFFALGFYQTRGNTWTGEPWVDHHNLTNADFATQYTTSTYFILCTVLTVGYGDISPVTNSEKVSAIIGIVIGALFYAVIFGNVALLINTVNFTSSQHDQRKDALERFINHYKRQLPAKLVRFTILVSVCVVVIVATGHALAAQWGCICVACCTKYRSSVYSFFVVLICQYSFLLSHL